MVNIPITGSFQRQMVFSVLLWYKLKDVDQLRVCTSTVQRCPNFPNVATGWKKLASPTLEAWIIVLIFNWIVWQFANGPKCVDDKCWWSPSIIDKHIHEYIAVIPCMAHIAHSFGCRVIVVRKKIYWSCLHCILSCSEKLAVPFQEGLALHMFEPE